jgi:hypothetical protein
LLLTLLLASLLLFAADAAVAAAAPLAARALCPLASSVESDYLDVIVIAVTDVRAEERIGVLAVHLGWVQLLLLPLLPPNPDLDPVLEAAVGDKVGDRGRFPGERTRAVSLGEPLDDGPPFKDVTVPIHDRVLHDRQGERADELVIHD